MQFIPIKSFFDIHVQEQIFLLPRKSNKSHISNNHAAVPDIDDIVRENAQICQIIRCVRKVLELAAWITLIILYLENYKSI